MVDSHDPKLRRTLIKQLLLPGLAPISLENHQVDSERSCVFNNAGYRAAGNRLKQVNIRNTLYAIEARVILKCFPPNATILPRR